jgi:hypothetical protein
MDWRIEFRDRATAELYFLILYLGTAFGKPDDGEDLSTLRFNAPINKQNNCFSYLYEGMVISPTEISSRG